jgi:hypothetical protein
MRSHLMLAVAAAGISPAAAHAGNFDRALLKLAPQERAHQACVIKGLDVVRRDPRLRHADRMKTSILSPSTLEGTLLSAKGGAVRANHRWYAIKFTCRLSNDLLHATSFSFELGQEIAQNKWETYGLWR